MDKINSLKEEKNVKSPYNSDEISKEADKNSHITIDQKTERRILDSARNVFYRKGLSGARMQEIADEAGINKAMLHYYYRTKDKLFEAVFLEAAKKFFPRVIELFNVDLPFFEKIEYFVENYITLMLENHRMPSFVLNEIHQNPERLEELFKNHAVAIPERAIYEFQKAMMDGVIKPVDPRQIVINMIALCVFPIVARPIIQILYSLTDEQYLEFIEARKKEVSKFIINSIKTD
ncbi:TetR/AcrR family transcriptional regulator [bacterium]|nr:MAG: TetR/AcrR family transcriptional regulator [bacterium]